MIKVYLSKNRLDDGREVIMQHISNPRKLQIVKEIINTVRVLSFGDSNLYKWEPKLEEFEGRDVIKISIEETNPTDGEEPPYNLDKIECFSVEKEIGTLEVLLSEGISRERQPVVFQWTSNPERLRNAAIRSKIDEIRNQLFPSLPVIVQTKIKNFEFKSVVKLTFNGRGQPKIEKIARFRQKPADGVYKAPKSTFNLGSGQNQAKLLIAAGLELKSKRLSSTLEEIAGKEFFAELKDRINQK